MASGAAEGVGSVSVEYGWVREDTFLYLSITVVIVLVLVGILLLRTTRARGDSV